MEEKIEEKKELNNPKNKYNPFVVRKQIDWSYLSMWLLVFVFTVLIEFANADFNPDALKTADFWIAVFVINTASGIVLIAAKNKSIAKRKSESEQYIKLNGTISKVVDGYLYDDIKEFISIENFDRKKEKWLEHIYTKIYRLDRFAKQKDIDLYNSKFEEQKEQNAYCKKRKALLEKTTNEWLENNLHIVRIKYDYVTEAMVASGSNVKQKRFRPINRGAEQAKDLAPDFLLGIAWTSFLFSLVFDFRAITISTAILIVFKVLIIIYRHFKGKSYGVYFVDEKLVPELYSWLGFLKSYLNWRFETGKVQNKVEIKMVDITNEKDNK